MYLIDLQELQSKEKSIDKAIKHSGGASEGLVNRNSVLVEVLEDGQMEVRLHHKCLG